MEAIANRRTSHRVNYSESSDDDELGSSIARDVVQEVVDNFQELNKKKQFKKIYQFSENREDWKIVENKRVSKGNLTKTEVWCLIHANQYHTQFKAIYRKS